MTSFQDAPDKAMEDDKAMEAGSILAITHIHVELILENNEILRPVHVVNKLRVISILRERVLT